jgi:hypothetical protein
MAICVGVRYPPPPLSGKRAYWVKNRGCLPLVLEHPGVWLRGWGGVSEGDRVFHFGLGGSIMGVDIQYANKVSSGW